ncbi:MAG: hydantoinase/oxoprolinase family protein, partial [Candidatus Thorarchaeota archaeon]
LKNNIAKEFESEGRDPKEMIFKPTLRAQYFGMMDDLEVESPAEELSVQLSPKTKIYDSPELREITRRYDDLFEQIFKRGTKSPELGYHITKAIGTGIVPVPKPRLPEYELSGENPNETASKGKRDMYWDKKWHEALLWEMSKLDSGNLIQGPAIIEAPATTLVVPPGYKVNLDKHRIFHMEVK